jgi:hypothetical protein
MKKDPYTVLLLRPDYAAATFGHDTFLAHVTGENVGAALTAARRAACKADETSEPEDYYCLFCAKGHMDDLTDGSGSVCDEWVE